MRYPASLMLDAVKSGFEFAREPVVGRLPGGTLASLALSGGPTEPSNGNVVLMTRSRDNGGTWDEPRVVFEHGARGVWATELFVAGRQTIVFVHTYDASCRYRELRTYVSTTLDEGDTWSEPVSLPSTGLGGMSVRQGITLSSGEWLFPTYWQETRSGWDWTSDSHVDHMGMRWPTACGVLVSADRGVSYHPSGRIWSAEVPLWEPAVIEYAPGRLWMLIRGERAGVLYEAKSEDYGRTWTVPRATGIPNPGSKISLAHLGDVIVLLHNPSRRGLGEHRFRTPLSVWATSDVGRTWYRKTNITDPGEVAYYPHVVNDPPGPNLRFACEDARRHWLVTVPVGDLV